MNTNVDIKTFIEENNIRIGKDNFICLSDLISCCDRDGIKRKNISVVLSTARFSIWLEKHFNIEYDIRRRGHKMLKENKLQYTTGARHTKACWVHEKVFEYLFYCLYKSHLFPLTYRIENKFITTLRVILDGIIEFETQKRILNYVVDIYFPDINLCVEFDENHHVNCQNEKKDSERQYAIELALNCSFIRIKEDEYLQGINKVLKQLEFSY